MRTGNKRRQGAGGFAIAALILIALLCAGGVIWRAGLSAIAEQDIVLLRSYTAEPAQVVCIGLARADTDAVIAPLPSIRTEEDAANAEAAAAAARVSALAEQNPDCIGWLTLSGAGIDYPLMYSPAKLDYYINRNFEKARSRSGLPFLDGRCAQGGVHWIVYGHNMKDGSMFGSLDRFLDADFYDENRTLLLDTADGRTRFSVFAVFLTAVDESAAFRFYAYADLSDADDYAAYMQGVTEHSLYAADAPPAGTRLITLVTCSNHARDGRLVVVAAAESG